MLAWTKPSLLYANRVGNYWSLMVFSVKNLSEESKLFLLYLAPDVTDNCICEIHCIALDGFNLKLSSKEKKSRASRDSNLGLLDGRK